LVEIIVDVFKSLSIICYSEKESQVLQKKFYYDIISNKWELWEFYEKIKENKYAFVLKNPYNFVWRLLATDWLSDYYSMQRQKEEEIHTKRQQLIEKIEGGLEEIL
jgi:intein/homing endonuclease